MEVKLGYKQTEVGMIPEDWEVASLINRCEYADYRGRTPRKTQRGIFLITARNVRKGFIDYDESKEYIASDEYEIIMRRGKPRVGDVLITTEAPLGNVAQVDREDVALAQRIIKYRPKGLDLSSNYLKHYLLSDRFQRSLDANASGSTAKGIKGSILHHLLIAIPPTFAEQEAIAEALGDADALIESLEQLIAKKRQIKQGAVQELLRPKDEWIKTKLGSLGAFSKGSGIKKDESLSGDLPCVRYGEIYTRHNDCIRAFYSWISPAVAATARRLKTGDVLFAGSGETKEEIGKCVAFVDDVEAYAGGDVVILRPEQANSLFLGYYLNTPPIKRQKASKGQGDAVVHISSAALADIDLTLPPIEEQTVIAAILSDMDAEITALEAKLEKTRQLKQGMMQELLTGRIRLI